MDIHEVVTAARTKRPLTELELPSLDKMGGPTK
jgi:hypothetical protein